MSKSVINKIKGDTMDKFAKISLSSVIILLLACSCGLNDEQEKRLIKESEYGTLSNKVHEQNIYVKLYLPQAKFSASVDTIPFKVKNLGTTTETIGMEYRVEKYIKGHWYVVPFKPNVGFIMIAQLLKTGEIYKGQVSMDMLDYRLIEGRYRIVKKIGSIILGAEFQIID
ncbi:hypothetical protein CFK37_18980 [Virgibacillus phasianinus]|uniref:Bacterial Ig-like domain-containing protein n=1 Tax=Virgibacillus phasianinus TaxID=2017483 RepID=A0A220U7H1_9BACI|nr:immunoglobulin-like domain-containing protein [Virgibacillus phasianinus]ASK64089.1 hypothetical protein CFK37_18980 [Virgibacillus phasianinus]